MLVLVTGCAGFIASHVTEGLLARGDQVRGIDCFLDYYPREVKERNLAQAKENPNFSFIEADLMTADLDAACAGVDAVIHLAAQAGVRASWGKDFSIYCDSNIQGTQRLLEACAAKKIRLVYSSSSSIYGDAKDFPTSEDTLPQPISPYGVSKLAGEHLCRLYAVQADVPTISLRYFTVYGPRQRPDMAFHKFLRAQLTGGAITLYDDGEQTRDFTFVADVVRANLLALENGEPGRAYNIGGGSRVTVNHVLEIIGRLTGEPPRVERLGKQLGDVRHTHAAADRARDQLKWEPQTTLEEGLRAELEWLRSEID
ncbi:MAG: NAD-dependent epimerase/dehydratase family protein [bacterium]